MHEKFENYLLSEAGPDVTNLKEWGLLVRDLHSVHHDPLILQPDLMHAATTLS